jgi:hypothetical protein
MANKGKPGGRAPGIDPANKKRGPRTGDDKPGEGAARTNGTSGGHGETDARRVSAPAEPPGAPPARPSRNRDQ